MAYAANKKPGELTALTTLATDDVIVVGDTSDASEVAKHITKANLITDLQDELTITESQISDLGTYLTSVAINDVSDVTITTPADNEVLAYDGVSAWINQTPTEAGLQGVLSEGAFVDGDKTKLDGIEASADVTDTANVTDSGALMDSELTSIADVKALDQSVVSGASPVFATTNMTEGTDKNFVTDAEAVVIGNTSGTNTGDQTRASLGLDTTDSPQFAGVNVGHATDTTITRTGAGVIAVEGVEVTTNTATQTLTNKTLTDPKITTTENAQTGTTYTLVLTDASKYVSMSNASANTLTVPPNSSVAFPTGTRLMVQQRGAGSTTIAAGSGVTINVPTSAPLAIAEQYGSRGLLKTATDTWQLI
jgi:hypothetical protein